MLRVLDCLTLEHDPGVVLLAALLCVLGCASSTLVAGRVFDSRRSLLWSLMAGLSFGASAWSTHFVAMLAYRTSLAITYDASLTALSLLVGMVLVGGGFVLAVTGREPTADEAPPHGPRRPSVPMRRLLRLAGGAVVGGGVIALHYIGMAALRFPGTLAYERDLVLVSVVAALGLGALALSIIFGPARKGRMALGVLLLILVTVSLHFIGMGAAVLEIGLVDPGALAQVGIGRAVLIIDVTIVSLVVLVTGAAAALIDRRFASRRLDEVARLRTLADGAFEGLVIHRDRQLIDANLAARQMLGIDEEALAGYSLALWPGSGGDPLGDGEASRTEEIELPGADGRPFPAEIGRRVIALQDGSIGELIAIRDLTSRRESEARIAHLALHDPLTDLPNRRFFTDLCTDTIDRATRDGTPFAMFAIDLDDFKLVNDLHGHAAGDELIRTVARRIAGVVREEDVVARIGGDEFALIDRSPDQPARSAALAERLRSALAEPVRLEDVEVMTNASIGIATYPADGEDIEDLLRNADTAMYHAKADGKGGTRRFEAHMHAELERRRALEDRLRSALDESALSIAYQLLVRSGDRSPICFEALLRWEDEELGQVSPMEFIPVAERTGLIVAIGEFVMRRACLDAVSWPAPLRVAVNLSVSQFARGELVETVREALASSGLTPERLELEVTESLLIENREEAMSVLRALKAMGVSTAMDDFGTGYSSLGYLQSFGFDKIKIDRRFVAGAASDPESASIVRAIVAMGKSLHMRVVAEGVETHAQAELLTTLDCDEMQGFLIARPMPADEIAGFLAARTVDGEPLPLVRRA